MLWRGLAMIMARFLRCLILEGRWVLLMLMLVSTYAQVVNPRLDWIKGWPGGNLLPSGCFAPSQPRGLGVA